ncbi:MAG: hypothetical protein OSJ58_13765 [Dysosmobacter sp.]|nr:hypothetical protein [uncultured Oscillibacter sp.]MCX4372862.1 hypothetical protein [Dysosmobacter sp.]
MSASIKKLLRYVLCFLLFCVSLCSCGTIMLTPHEHEWQSATCTEPKICAKCGETEGEPLGHDWEEATCVSPKTCQRCGATDGVPAKHTWKLATCTEPEICIICGEVNRQSSPLGHDWIPPTLSAPTVCKRCGVQDGEPLALASFNRGSAGRWGPRPSADQYVGVSGYVAVALNSFQYASSDSPHENNFRSKPWYATTYEKDKQYWNPVGTIEHKTPVIVIEQELTFRQEGLYRYEGYLLVERIDNSERFYISITDFVAVPYWENLNVSDTVYSGPCLAEYHQISDFYPVDRRGRKSDIAEGAIVTVYGATMWGGVDRDANAIDALTDNGRCYFNDADLTIIY